jgi:hypothetical protein
MIPQLAQVLPVDPPEVSPAVWDLLLVGGVTLGLAAVIFLVVALIRRAPRHRRRARHGPEILKNTDEHLREQEEQAEAAEAGESRPKHRRKRRRRDHRPRNPTLAEAGGLPPERQPGQTPNSGS